MCRLFVLQSPGPVDHVAGPQEGPAADEPGPAPQHRPRAPAEPHEPGHWCVMQKLCVTTSSLTGKALPILGLLFANFARLKKCLFRHPGGEKKYVNVLFKNVSCFEVLSLATPSSLHLLFVTPPSVSYHILYDLEILREGAGGARFIHAAEARCGAIPCDCLEFALDGG